MIWMLHNAQTAVEYLDEIIAKGNEVRYFEYHIEGDPFKTSIQRISDNKKAMLQEFVASHLLM